MALSGCLLKKSADQTTANYSGAGGTAITWDTEVLDTHGFHSTSGDTELITIPAAMDGKYGVLTGQVSIEAVTAGTDNILVMHRDTGGGLGVFNGMGRMSNKTSTGQAATQSWLQCSSAPMLLTEGHTYALKLYSDDSSITVEASRSTFGIRILDHQTTMRVLAKLSADQTTQNFSTPAVIAFDGADVYDTDGIHDPASSNSKLIIPSALGGRYAVIRAGVQTSLDNGGNISLAIRKNGSLAYDGFGGKLVHQASQSTSFVSVITQPILLSTNDEFEALFYNSSDTSISIASAVTYLGLQVVG